MPVLALLAVLAAACAAEETDSGSGGEAVSEPVAEQAEAEASQPDTTAAAENAEPEAAPTTSALGETAATPTTGAAPEATGEPEATAVPAPTTSSTPEAEQAPEPEPGADAAPAPEPASEPETETELAAEQAPEPETETEPAPEPEPEPEPESEVPEEPTVTTVPPEPEPEPEPERANPALVVDPATASSAGSQDFTLTGAGFTPNLTVYTLVCTIPGDPVTAETPAEELAAAMARVERADCDLSTAQAVTVGADGSFTVQRSATIFTNFVWVASDAAETEAAAAPVFAEPEPAPETPEEPSTEVAEPQPGLDFVWVRPVAGLVPEPWPLCSEDVNTWDDSCAPPQEWQRGDGTVNPNDRANDLPRSSPIVLAWSDECLATGWGAGNCRWLLHEMHQALDYLGADPICVGNEYRARFQYFLRAGGGANGSYAKEHFGWHNCATVIDPMIGNPPAERVSDIGYRLSDTGLSLADRCRAVLTDPFPDIELETRGNSVVQPTQFGSDCDAWATYIGGKRAFSSFRVCAASMSLAEEWMEHVHGQPESYFRPLC